MPAAILTVGGFIAAVAAGAAYLRRRDDEGAFDPGASSVSRFGLPRFFDFGRGGWSEDGMNQPPND